MLRDLQGLYLQSNTLSDVEMGAFTGLLSLAELNLHGNQLTEVPAGWFANDSALSALDCSINNISSISGEFFQGLPALRFLNLSSNALGHLSVTRPENDTRWTHALEVFDLSQNELSNLGACGFQGFSNLQQLFLATNRLALLEPSWFNDLSNLTHLTISDNPLVMLPSNVFAASGQLEWLNISHMPNLRYVDSASLTGLDGLTVIDLSHNPQLENLHALTFRPVTNINFIDLSHDGLTYINSATFQNLTQMERVRLTGNPWVCNCETHWIGLQLTNMTTNHSAIRANVIDPDDLVCATPRELKGLHLMDIFPFRNFSCQGAHIVNFSVNAYFKVGSSAVLDCTVEGDPKPYIKWVTPKKEVLHYHPAYVNHGQPGPQHSAYHLGHDWHHTNQYAETLNIDQRIHVLRNGSLYIDYVLRGDSGPYTCIVHNDLGNDTVVIHFKLNYLVITETMVMSMLVGFISAGCFFIVGLTVGLIRYLTFKCSHEQRQKRKSIREILEGLETYKTDKMGKLYAYKTAKIDQLSAFKSAKVDKLRGYKNVTVTTLVHYLHRSREHYSGQMLRIKDNYTQQVEKLRESYSLQKLKFHDYRSHQVEKIRENYNGQLLRIRQYGSGQVERLREQYKLQQHHILKLLELMDIGNCMSVIEAECLRTESMIFNPDLTFDLYTTANIPCSVSQSGSEYMTAGDNTDISSEHSIINGSINFTVKMENETTTLNESGKEDPESINHMHKVTVSKQSGKPQCQTVSDQERTRFPLTNQNQAEHEQTKPNQTKDNSGHHAGKTKHSRRKHRNKQPHHGIVDDEEDINSRDHQVMRGKEQRERREQREKREHRDAKGRDSEDGKSKSQSRREPKKRHGRNSNGRLADQRHKKSEETPLDIASLRNEPLTLSLPDLIIDFSLDGPDFHHRKAKQGRKLVRAAQEISDKQTAGLSLERHHREPEVASVSYHTVHPHIEHFQKQASTDVPSTDYESAQEPESRTATPHVSIEEQTGTPQSFASFPSAPSTPTLPPADPSLFTVIIDSDQHSHIGDSPSRESTV